MFGDPHVYTFDNMPYTFNGMGEHFLFVFLGGDNLLVFLFVWGFFYFSLLIEQILMRQFFPKIDMFDLMRMNGCVSPGEYVLVRANSPKVKLDIQGRFEQVSLIFKTQN